MEGETMRVMYESWFVKYKVDVVFAGHVHAYERSVSVPYPLQVINHVIRFMFLLKCFLSTFWDVYYNFLKNVQSFVKIPLFGFSFVFASE